MMIEFYCTETIFVSNFMKIDRLVQKLQPFFDFQSLAGISAYGGVLGQFLGVITP